MAANVFRFFVYLLLIITTTPISAQDEKISTTVDALDGFNNKRLLVESYWGSFYLNNVNISNDSLIHKMQEWGVLLKNTEDDTLTHCEVNKFLNYVCSNDVVFEFVSNNIQNIFYDFFSPARNSEAYIAVLDWMLKSDKCSDLEKSETKALLNVALNNRKGEKANDFCYYLLNDEKCTLHSIESPYVLIFFNSPGCSHCVEYKKELDSYPIIDELITNKQLVVLGVYADDNPQEWADGASSFPKKWINSIDKGLTVLNNGLYDLYPIPNFYLLDKDKTVLLKKPTPKEITQYLNERSK